MEKRNLVQKIKFSARVQLRQGFKGKVNEREANVLDFLGTGTVLSETRVTTLFLPCMVLWHLGQEWSNHHGMVGRAYYYSESGMVAGCPLVSLVKTSCTNLF